MAIQRAEDKTAQMQARAGAIDELIASGALDDASSINRGDDIARELEAMSSQSDVEAELAAPQGRHAAAGHRAPATDAGDILEADAGQTERRRGRRRRHDRPDPRRGPVRRRRRRSSTRSTSSTRAVEAAVEAGDEDDVRAPPSTALLDGVRARRRAAAPTTRSTTPT